MAVSLGLDIGSNSVGSAWINQGERCIKTGTSIFPAGVDESDDKRGDPKNAKRRMARRTRITLARRAARKRELRLKLVSEGLLPPDSAKFKELLETTDPWILRRKGLDERLTPHQFGRVLLHLAQRRGAMGLDSDDDDKGKMKQGIRGVQMQLLDRYGSRDQKYAAQEVREKIKELGGRKKRTDEEDEELEKANEGLKSLCMEVLQRSTVSFGRLMADLRDAPESVHEITTEDKRAENARKGPREYRDAIRNKAGSYQHCADRPMIRDEFAKLWDAQKRLGGELSGKLTDDLRRALDDESRDAIWKHKGLLFGQRLQSWDLGTLGRCVLEPTERCAPHADMYASRYLVVETVNNLKIVERGKEPRALTAEERRRILDFLSGPLGMETRRGNKGESKATPPRAKQTVTVAELRAKMSEWYGKGNWPRNSKFSPFRFNIESDEERAINTDWFSREIIHGAVTMEKWRAMPESVREGINRAILKYDAADDNHAAKLKKGVMNWAEMEEGQADALVASWKKRPKLEAKRLNMSRRAVRNLLAVMDREEPWSDSNRPGQTRWLTQIEARKLIAQDADFKDVMTRKALDDHARRRYATGAKGATARDRHYMEKHLVKKDGQPIFGPDGLPLHEPPPAPMISNPVVRKAIHEVRRHIVEYMMTFGRKPDEICVELSREAKMGKVDADRQLFINRLRDRIKKEIITTFNLHGRTATQQRAAVERVVLSVQQGGAEGICPLCGKAGLTPRKAALGEDCEVAHIFPKGQGGQNGLTNKVLAHKKCNQDMARRTPQELWGRPDSDGFNSAMQWIERIYGNIERIEPSEVKQTTGEELWKCYTAEQARPRKGSNSDKAPNYFSRRLDKLKIEQFKKDKPDPDMTARQDAATKYASRQVMAYLSDGLFDGKGLPERGGERKIFAVDGMWTSRLRREWGLFFDPHGARAHGLGNDEERLRKEKNRGDHHHHAIDAVVVAYCSRQVQILWEEREKQADRDGFNTADEEAMENYRRLRPLPPPAPFDTREEFREAVRRAVFGEGIEKPICHRPVKRKLIGALHKATEYGPVLDTWEQNGEVHRELVDGRVTVRQPILGEAPNDFLKKAHLREQRLETDDEAIERLARRLRVGKRAMLQEEALKAARKLVRSKAFTRSNIDPKPEKGGLVRDFRTRCLLRRQLKERGIDPDKEYTKSELKQSIDRHGPLKQDSGVPIHGVVLLWSNSDPVTIERDGFDYASGHHRKVDDPGSLRLYDGQNNHHIEIRAAKNKKGNEVWSGEIISTFEVAQRKLAKLRAFREAGVPKAGNLRKLPKAERAKLGPTLRAIEEAYPLVDRRDNDEKGGRFVMSLCEGEMLYMKHKQTGEVGYFVVAKLDKPQSIVLVPHWDARAATERKTAEGNKVPDSKREQFSVTPSDLKDLAPPGCTHAVKIRVSPLGVVTELKGD